jgi:NADH-quinone oxidoreductase subunit N
MPQYSSADILALAPALVLVVGALILLLLEVFQDSNKRGYQSWFTAVLAGIAAFAAVPLLSGDPHPILAVEGHGPFAVADRFGGFVAIIVSLGLGLSALVAGSFLGDRKANRGEFYALASFGAAGMILLAQATDLLMIFVALEIMSISTYALAAYNRRGIRSTEAAFKYFILGAFSTALFIYGVALVYGATGGQTGLAEVAAASADGGILLLGGLAFVTAGFFFKVAAAPFHMWTPDVYEGAPTPVTAFMAAGVKAAAFASLVRVLTVAFGSEELALHGWLDVVAVVAILTMVVGNLLAVPQRSVKRLLAYSSIAHAGYLLVGVAAAAHPEVRAAAGEGILYYLAAYTFTGIGAFAVVAALERQDGEGPMSWDLDRFAGIAKVRPALALSMALFMLSLAGIPPTAGFIGKLFIFRAAVDAKLYTLAILGVLTSLVGVYYYLRVVVTMYMRDREPSVGELPAARMAMGVALAGAAIGTLLLGIAPGLFGEIARLSSMALAMGG